MARSTIEPGWQWKGDTSSDELSGHFFSWGVYYDYVAKGDPVEEKRVQELVRRVVNHLIDHDFTLTDVDGYPTRWAVYSPRLLNGDLQWSDQVGFNALGILAHLKVAIHICGDQKFKDAYKMLIDKWGYNVKAMFAKEMIPNTPNAGLNHSDDEMAWLEYYHLLLYPDGTINCDGSTTTRQRGRCGRRFPSDLRSLTSRSQLLNRNGHTSPMAWTPYNAGRSTCQFCSPK